MKNISIILVGTQSSGNIGAVARCMMNTGFSDLRLVNPEVHHLNRECLDRAMTAEPIVKKAQVFLTLKEAVSDCHKVVGTSGKTRVGRMEWRTPKEFAEKISTEKTALVFGKEESGLTNEELLLCDQVIAIPTSSDLPSLNLSHAVLIILYEIFIKLNVGANPCVRPSFGQTHGSAPTNTFATQEQKEALFDHMQLALGQINFIDKQNPDKIMRTLRTLISRLNPDDYEVGVLRGICRQILNRTIKDE